MIWARTVIVAMRVATSASWLQVRLRLMCVCVFEFEIQGEKNVYIRVSQLREFGKTFVTTEKHDRGNGNREDGW